MPGRKINRYSQAFREIGLRPNTKVAREAIKELEATGRTESSICFAIWRERKYLQEHREDEDFWKIFKETVKKWSWDKDDPRWEDWHKKKEQEDKAREKQKELEKQIKERTYKTPYDQELKGFIYFIQGECGGPIKIGYTTDLVQRIKSLQTSYPDRLELLLAFPGRPEYEKAIHSQFEAYPGSQPCYLSVFRPLYKER